MAPVAVSPIPEKAPTYVASKYEVLENYEGAYKFAPIQEAQVSRAMIKR
jgi:hypothetical protein